jgi:hypothetical protein
MVAFNFLASSQGTPIFQENFETTTGTALPVDWTKVTTGTDGGFLSGSNTGLSSQFFPVPTRAGRIVGTNDDKCNCNKSNEILWTPVIDLAGNNRMWLVFDYFFVAGSDAGRRETFNMVATTDNGTTIQTIKAMAGSTAGWQKGAINLAAFASTANLKLGFRYNDGGGWTYGLMLDNVAIFEPIGRDLALSNFKADPFGEQNDILPYTATVRNESSTDVTSFKISVTDGTTTFVQTLDSLVPAFTTKNFAGSLGVPLAKPNKNTFRSLIAEVNGSPDNVPANDTSGLVEVYAVKWRGDKVLLGEQGTGTWCTWCPRGHVAMEALAANKPDDFFGVAVHTSNGATIDPMAITAYANAFRPFVSGYPGAAIDRNISRIDPSDIVDFFDEVKGQIAPANIKVTATVDSNSRTMNIDVESRFAFDRTSSPFLLSCVVKEDSLTGTGAGWAQVNAYAGGSRGPMGGYELLPNPVPASQMVYDDVARALIGGMAGQTGSLPSNLKSDTTYKYRFTYPIPTTQRIRKLSAGVTLSESTTSRVFNTGFDETVEIICPRSLKFTATPTLASAPGLSDGSILLTAPTTNGITPYTYLWSDGKTTKDNQGIANGLYSVTITNGLGCTETRSFSLFSTSAFDLPFVTGYQLNPNPVIDQANLNIQFSETVDFGYQLIDITGRVILSQNNFKTNGGVFAIPMSNLSAGQYFLRLSANGKIASEIVTKL